MFDNLVESTTHTKTARGRAGFSLAPRIYFVFLVRWWPP